MKLLSHDEVLHRLVIRLLHEKRHAYKESQRMTRQLEHEIAELEVLKIQQERNARKDEKPNVGKSEYYYIPNTPNCQFCAWRHDIEGRFWELVNSEEVESAAAAGNETAKKALALWND